MRTLSPNFALTPELQRYHLGGELNRFFNTPNEIDLFVGLTITLFLPIFPWSTGFTRSDFCRCAVEPHGCSGGGITIVPKSNCQVLLVGPRASRVAMRAHNRKIRFGPWSYLNLLDLHSLETIAEWTGKAAVFVSLCWQVGDTTPPLIRDCGCLRHCILRTPS